MRFLILLVVGGLVGWLGGIWQAKTFVPVSRLQVGEEFNDMQKEMFSELNKNKAEVAAKIRDEGVLPDDLVSRVEVVGGIDFNFGTMKRGTERSHEFIFKNVGGAPLKLAVSNSTCKCTVGSVTEDYIQPGTEVPVKLTWKAEGIQNDFAQTATISTNDPRMREIKLTITGRIGTSYIFEPDNLNLGEFSASDTVTRKFMLYSMEDSPLKVNGYWSDLDQVSLTSLTPEIRRVEPGEIPKYADARWVADITLTINPGLPAGPLNTQLRMMVGPEELRFSIPVTGKCVSHLSIIATQGYDKEKNLMELGRYSAVNGGESPSFYISAISDRQDLTLEVENILPKSLAKSLKVEIGEPKRSSKRTLFSVKFIIPPGSPPVDLDGGNSNKNGVIDFKSNIENSGKISMFLRLIVE